MPDPRLPMFYRNVVALSRDRHKDWYIDTEQGYRFAANTNSIYIVASEFAPAAREYAIVFARDREGNAIPAILLGLQRDQNLILDSAGRWQGEYVPAYVRRYPFILASTVEMGDQFTVCIDEAYTGFNTAQEGQRLVAEDGTQGELLSRSVKFLQEFHQHTVLTVNFCKALDSLGLLDNMQAEISLNSGAKYSLTGLFCVTRAKLAALTADQLKTLFDQGYLDLIYLHMHSLNNIDKLMRLVQVPQPVGEAVAS
jgi:SapC